MENPSRNPSIASTSASVPAVVFAILNVALIAPVPSSDISIVFPILRVRSCSRFKKTFFGSMDPFAKTTLPVDAFAGSSNATMRPVIVRETESAAVIVIGVVSFIRLDPLLFEFPRLTLRQYD